MNKRVRGDLNNDARHDVGCLSHRPSTLHLRLLCLQHQQVILINPAFIIVPLIVLSVLAAASVLSFLSLTNYVAIATVVASSVSALIEYNAAPRKLGRYNASVLALHISLNWWASLSDMMKKDRTNVAKLILESERA